MSKSENKGKSCGNDANTPISNESHDRSQTDYINANLAQINQEQLAHTENKVNLEDSLNDVASDSSFTESGKGAYGAETKGTANLEKYVETSRFAHEINIDGLEQSIRKNEGMKLNQKVDSPADSATKTEKAE